VLVVWIVALVLMRSHQNPRRDWNWIVPVGLMVAGCNWLAPSYFSLALVYLHPLVALWFLDRELLRTRSSWHRSYRLVLCALPLVLMMLWAILAQQPDFAHGDLLTLQITQHAGSDLISGVSGRTLVATHALLELLHYGVWVVAIPLVSLRSLPWKLDDVPLAKRSVLWRKVVFGSVIAGGVIMVLLWGAFLTDYPATRYVYFTVAVAHVLAEIPFLLRLL
jgi:hypothetical protein